VEQAKASARDKDVSVSPGNIGGQSLAAGLVDEVRVDLVPVVFGAGTPGTREAVALPLEDRA
jgi:hypothetical protein